MPRPTASDQIRPGSEWDFRHLGARYFRHYLQRCADDGLVDITVVYTGNEGNEYVMAQAEPHRVRPNFMAENATGDFRAYQAGAPKAIKHLRKNVISWPYADIVAFVAAEEAAGR